MRRLGAVAKTDAAEAPGALRMLAGWAAERGLAVRLVTDAESPDHRNLVTLRGTLADGSQVSVSGTLIGIHQRERLVELNGYDVDLEPTEQPELHPRHSRTSLFLR